MRKTWMVVAAGAALGIGFAGCSASRKVASVEISSGTVISNITVIDTLTGQATPNQSVVIVKGKIEQVLPSDAVKTSGTARVIDGSGKFVVPGYLDMHTHVLPAAVFQRSPAWPLLIANGVTGVREMVGVPPLIAAARRFNADRAAGTLDSPEILQIPGNVITGAATAASGVEAVMQTKAIGGDFVKVVAATPEALGAIMQTAKAQGLDVAGHLTAGTGALDSVKAGMKAIEHLGGGWSIALDCARDQAGIRADLLAGKGAKMPSPFPPTYPVSPYRYSADDAPFMQRAMDSYDAAACAVVARTMAQSATWQVPTMIRLNTMTNSDAAVFRQDPNLKYVDPTTKGLWNKLSAEFETMQPASAPMTIRKTYGSFVSTLRLLREQGGASKIMTGTDVGGIWVIPGFSLHQEFGEFAAAGFTPLQILQATTINGARFLKREATMGTVEAGKNADLVLLDANPVADVANLSKIAGVVNAGKYFAKADLDAMKDAVARAAAAAPMRPVSAVLDPTHKH